MEKIKRYITKEKKRFSAKLAHTQSGPSIVAQSGFSSHLDAQAWADEEFYKIVPNPETTSFIEIQKLMDHDPNNVNYRDAFEDKVMSLTATVGLNLVEIDGVDEDRAYERACSVVGTKHHVLLKRSKDGTLDAIWVRENTKFEQFAKQLAAEVAAAANADMSDFLTQDYPAEEKSVFLLKTIQKMPGSKILTLTFAVKNQPITNSFYVHENGHVGDSEDEPSLRNGFLSNVDYMLNSNHGGSVIIRQFIPNSEEVEIINGREVSIPWKALYAMHISNNMILPLSAEDVEHAMNHDSNTGQEIDPEDKVVYKDFNQFLNQHPSTVPKTFK